MSQCQRETFKWYRNAHGIQQMKKNTCWGKMNLLLRHQIGAQENLIFIPALTGTSCMTFRKLCLCSQSVNRNNVFSHSFPAFSVQRAEFLEQGLLYSVFVLTSHQGLFSLSMQSLVCDTAQSCAQGEEKCKIAERICMSLVKNLQNLIQDDQNKPNENIACYRLRFL